MNLDITKRIAELTNEINGRIESIQSVANGSFDTYYIIDQCSAVQKMVVQINLLEELLAENKKVPSSSYN